MGTKIAIFYAEERVLFSFICEVSLRAYAGVVSQQVLALSSSPPAAESPKSFHLIDMSSSSSPSGNQESESRFASYRDWIHDVFVSFTKEDNSSQEFVSDLYGRLKSAGVRVFKDEMEPRSGDQILLKAIERSRVSIIVFTTDYADSTWCLQELEKVMECRSSKGQVVVPVFYEVDPSDVHDQMGHFGQAFRRTEERESTNKNKVLGYRNALQQASCLSGFEIDIWKESEAIENIVERVTDFVDGTGYRYTMPKAVGLEARVQDLIQLLNYHKSDDVLLLGIWGMAGIGKTTVAKALYYQISHHFEGKKFLSNVSSRCLQGDAVSLQEELLSGICKTNETKILNIKSGKLILKKNLCCKRILLVLDDVTRSAELELLCESRDWFGPGSRIIITTRDKLPFTMVGVDYVYTVKELDYNESVELFSWKAFKKEIPEGYYRELVERAVEYCGGMPLALLVLGFYLRGKTMKEWESALEGLKINSHHDIRSVLKLSYDSLEHPEKETFLRLACFFVGMDRNDVMQILLNDCRISAEFAMRVLEDKCLVTVDEENKLQMHKLLQQMGREIAHQTSYFTPTKHPRYDVFLSFRGKDTRTTFTSHLHAALRNAGFYVFKDDIAVSRGEWISTSLMGAIRESRISVIILSTNYADSRWCLEELENIMLCYRTTAHAVVPIFYGVDPTEVRNQTGIFGQAFEDLIKRFPVNEDKVLSWRTSLREVGSLSGIVVVNSRNESDDIKKVVEDVTRLLDKTELFVANYPVGITSRVQNAIKLLKKQQSKDVLLLGICGMGGIGKTTIAKAIYNQIGRNFEGRCFLLNIREVWEQDNGQVSLQERLLYYICKTTRIVIHNIESGKNELKDRLRHKKVFLVLDDINKLEQMNALCGSLEWFSPGSYIIITTRDEHLVRVHGVDPIIYRLKEMDESEAVELFSWHAFKQASPKSHFTGLSRDVVAYSSGLPLALEVLGSYLCDREIAEWKNALKKLQRIPNHEVQKKLKISYDNLNDDTEKEIFLDIACFFIGRDRSDVIHILNDCGLYAENGISVLRERSLVTVDNKNKLGMHNLLRDMGREIIRKESPDEPEKRSRLWFHEEVLDVLTKYQGTKAIKGLALRSPRTPISLCTKAFKKMKKLRLLQLAGVQLDGDFKYLSRDLRWTNWHGFPLSYTPKDCYQESSIVIELEYSNLELVWKEPQLLNKLKILNLSHSRHLRQTPDFSYLPNLEKIILKDCPSLSSVSHTIGHLNELLLINLKDCTSLRSLPRSIYKLKSLKTLILSGCLMIDKLEEDLEQMESLTVLKADNTAITQVPNALARLKSIGYISLGGFKGLARDMIPSIIWSWTSPTNNVSSRMRTSPSMWSCPVSFVSSSSFQGLSSIISKLPKRRSLRLECGSQLQITGEVALDTLNATDWKELEATATTPLVSSSDDVVANMNENAFGVVDMAADENVSVTSAKDMVPNMNGNASGVDDMTADENVTVFGVVDMVADMNENASDVDDMAEYENVIVSSVDDVGSNTNKKASGIHGMAADENVIVSDADDMATDMNESGSGVDDMVADKNVTVSDILADNNNDIVSGEDETRFGRSFKLPSLVHVVLKTWPCCSGKQGGLTSFQVSQPTPAFKEAEATPTKQIEQWLDEEETSSKTKRQIPPSSRSVVKPVPQCQRVVAAPTTKTFKPQSEGLTPSGQTPLAPNIEDAELTLTAKGIHETINVAPTSLDLPPYPTLPFTTTIPIMRAEDGDLLAELEKILSESYILSPTKDASAASGSEVQSLPVIAIFQNIQELLDNELEVLVANGDIRKQLLHYLAQLGQMKSQVPTNLQPLVNEIKHFYEHVLNNFPSIQEVLANNQRLIVTKNGLQKKLETAEARQAHFSISIAKGKDRLNEMSKEITDLEVKLKALSEKREKLQSTVKLCDVETHNINRKVATWLKEGKEVVGTLKASESAFKMAESSKQSYEKKLADLKQALGNIRP